MSCLCGLLAALAMLCAMAPAAAQELRGVALVVGNGDYAHLPTLDNPAADADAIEDLLSDLGFDPVVRTDRDARQLARDLDRFVEDAAEADVAVLYYAGHGIEAGGENFLVPVDADLAALDAADERLVPLSAVLERLRRTVAVTIVLLDACRDNPFPEPAMLRRTPNATGLPVSAGGLAETRGARPLAPLAGGNDALGMVIGFAAEPGRPALDGPAGSLSPYAAALLRHVSAMAGTEFGTVMRMVAEEVYLKTGGRQRPWVNESLRRLLYFGQAAPEPEGDEGDILRERRQLLLTIAALPDRERRQVERTATDAGVPMDALYAMIRALGQEVPQDPAELERLLRTQAAQVKKFLAERAVIENTDPELRRLSELSDVAVTEGALDVARRLRQAVAHRIAELSMVVEQAERNIRDRRIEFAAEFARSGEISALSFEHDEAADYYGRAYEQVARWEPDVAWAYRAEQVAQLLSFSSNFGDSESLARADAIARDLVGLAAALGPARRAQANVALAEVQSVDAARAGDLDRLAAAEALIDGSYDALDSREHQVRSLRIKATIAVKAGVLREDLESFRRGARIYEKAIELIDRRAEPGLWIDLQNERANVLGQIAVLASDGDAIEEALDSLEETDQYAAVDADPLRRVMLLLQRDAFQIARDAFERGPDAVAAAAYDSLLDRLASVASDVPEDRFPRRWATLQYLTGLVRFHSAERTGDVGGYSEAAQSLRRALIHLSREATTVEWGNASETLARTLLRVGTTTDDRAALSEAVRRFDDALAVAQPQNHLPGWVSMLIDQGVALRRLGTLTGEPALLRRSDAQLREAVEVARRADNVPELIRLRRERALALYELERLDGDVGHLHEIVILLEGALVDIDASHDVTAAIEVRQAIGDTAYDLGGRGAGREWFGRAIDAYEDALALVDPADRLARGLGLARLGRAESLAGWAAGDASLQHRAVERLDAAGAELDAGGFKDLRAGALADKANALARLARVRDDETSFEAARVAYLEVLPLLAGVDLPTHSLTMRNYGLLLYTEGSARNEPKLLDRAADVFRDVIEAEGSADGSLRASINLGDTLVEIARVRDHDARVHLEEAVSAFGKAIALHAEPGAEAYLPETLRKRADATRRIGLLADDADLLITAAEDYGREAELHRPERYLAGWAVALNARADTLMEAALRSDGIVELRQARDTYLAVFERYDPDWPAMGRAELRLKAANAARVIGDRTGDPKNFDRAVAGYRAALAIARDQEVPDFIAGVTQNLEETLRLREALSTGAK